MILAIDFDGTIVTQDFPRIGKLLTNAKEVINRLHEKGHYIIIWTCRNEYSLINMIKFLDEERIHYDKINENAPYEMIGFKPYPKIFCHLNIDDRNLQGLPDWLEIEKLINEKEEIIMKTYVDNFQEIK